MQDWEDNVLLREYAERGSEEAFAILVSRHVNKVYSVALRHTKNPHLAEEITQTVFVILARKAAQLGKKVILEGWLYQTARLTAVTAIRSEIRRNRREMEAHMQNTPNDNEFEVWQQIEPLLDNAMESLNEPDRNAVVLRYFYGKSMKEVGTATGRSEGAATLRLHRALEKLRRFFSKYGIRTTAVVLATAITAHSVKAAPATLAKSITTASVAKGVAAGGSASALLDGVLKAVAWAKVKFALGVSAAIIIAAAGGTELYSLHKSTVLKISQNHFPRSDWKNDGFGTPEATLNTFFWAQSAGNDEVFTNTSAKELADYMAGWMFSKKTKEERPAALMQRVKDMTGVVINRKMVFPDGRVSLDLGVEGTAADPFRIVLIFTNMVNNWKLTTIRQFSSGGSVRQFPFPVELTEADFAPRAGSDLQGYWSGAIHTPRGDSRLNVKIAEPTDGDIRADFFNIEQGGLRRPASVERDGTTITIRPMWTTGMFQGKLRNNGTELEGNWIQGARELPATLSRTNWVKP